MVLVLIDVINRFDFKGGEKLVQFAIPMARRIVALKRRAKPKAYRPSTLTTISVVGSPTLRLSLTAAYLAMPQDNVLWNCCDPKQTITLC